MEIVIQKEMLANGIQIVQNAVTQKSSLPILANVLLEATPTEIKLTATDLDIGICAMIPIEAGEKGAITIPAKKFFDIIRALPDGSEIKMTIKKSNSIVIRAEKAQFKIIGLPKEDFPALPLFEDKDSITLPQNMFKEMINLTDFAISRDDARHVLTGALMVVRGEHVTLVTTDGRRMAMSKKPLPQKTLVSREVIVPIKTIQEVKRLLGESGEVRIQFSDNQVMFSFASSFVVSRLLEGEFPDYCKVIPERSKQSISLATEDFLSAARRISILTDQDSQAVKINIQKSKMTISKNTPYLGEAKEEVSASFNGDKEIDIGFNPKYLIDVLRNINEENVEFEVNDFNKPGVIRKGDEYVYVLLPMQIIA
ncbi:MAG: DNA polymerase III subunit beta [Candidatus Omnitrophica bacterium]|nr:DNA polymerase III subunit beta [Candidatus Omnitrophota bacterium]MBU1128711.1 DNA polymerase III subunit beta [Candidatus Omnitrophota bacterium]MBU1656871.1 DNA polymerase III subunit beta [Candidatus Omnitrophota bacterium]MBU1784826.1 DNA polymerase III subunit beta [Candidatus Omnitrophota bacterium]MBU1850988.1 DNA polymerase III subunit beta [Candidatus Omnitrophota bacterium]